MTTVSFILKGSAEQTLGALKGILRRGQEHARNHNLDEAVLLSHRLYPDMFDLIRQVQIACDTVARAAARLAGLEMPAFPDTESDFAGLIERCDAALGYVRAVDDQRIDDSTHVTLQIPVGQATLPMQGQAYLQGFVLPNLHFHAAIAYGLLRAQGVALGKRDFLVPA